MKETAEDKGVIKEKETKDDEEEEEEFTEEDPKITRQLQIQKLHFNISMSTEDPNETMEYLVNKAKEVVDCYSKVNVV